MSYIRYPVPAYDDPGLYTGSRAFQGLTTSALPGVPPRLGVQVQGQTNQGSATLAPTPAGWQDDPGNSRVIKKVTAGTNFNGAVDLGLTLQIDTIGVGRPFPRTVTGRDPQDAPQRSLESRSFRIVKNGQGVVDLGLTLQIDTIGVATTIPVVARAPREPHSPEQILRGSRILRPLGVAGSLDLGLTLQIDTVGSARPFPRTVSGRDPLDAPQRSLDSRFFRVVKNAQGVVDLGLTLQIDTAGVSSQNPVPPPRVYQAKQPQEFPGPQDQSRTVGALIPVISGAVDLGLTLQIDTSGNLPAGPRLGIAIAGGTNQYAKTRAPENPGPDTPLLESRGFVYYNAAPPIYRVIVPGSTNQGYQFEAVPVTVGTVPPSRWFKSTASTAASVDLGLTLNIDTVGTARPLGKGIRALAPVEAQQAYLESRIYIGRKLVTGVVDLALTLGIDTGGAAAQRPVITRGRDTIDPIQRLLESRFFVVRKNASGQVDLPIVFSIGVDGLSGSTITYGRFDRGAPSGSYDSGTPVAGYDPASPSPSYDQGSPA